MALPGHRTTKYLLLLISLLGYIGLGYFTERSNFNQVISLFTLLFAVYILIVRNASENQIKLLMGVAILFRVALLFMIPNLSDDYFRFIWDGRLWTHGVNPFLQLPSDLIATPDAAALGLTPELYQGLNSPDYYTIYPPVAQGVFYLAALITPNSILGSIVIMRSSILLAEIGSIVLLAKLAQPLNLSKNVLWYALNPLVIIELTGNLHFEGIMIFFTLLSIYLFMKSRWLATAGTLALAVASKLVPLVFFPFFIQKLGWKRSLWFFPVAGLFILVLFAPVFNLALLEHLLSSVNLYFQSFEFNASIYYIARWIGYQITGYNTIAILGKVLSATTLLVIMGFAWKRKGHTLLSLLQNLVLGLTIYFFLATTVHPWYITTLVALSCLTYWRFPILWSGLVTLTYYTYRTTDYQENLWLVGLEYALVSTMLIYELARKKQENI